MAAEALKSYQPAAPMRASWRASSGGVTSSVRAVGAPSDACAAGLDTDPSGGFVLFKTLGRYQS